MFSKIKELLGIKPQPNYKELLKKGGTVIDVRSKAEYSSGHIKGSQNIPLQNLDVNSSIPKNKEEPIITCCASGMRSARAKKILKSKGYQNVFNGGSWAVLDKKLNES
jgi:phage shock protein E